MPDPIGTDRAGAIRYLGCTESRFVELSGRRRRKASMNEMTLRCYICKTEATFSLDNQKAAVDAGWRMVPGGNIICPRHAEQRSKRFDKERAKRRRMVE